MPILSLKSEQLRPGDPAVCRILARRDVLHRDLPIRRKGNEDLDAKEFGLQALPGYVAEVSSYVSKDFGHMEEDFWHVAKDFGHVSRDFGHVVRDFGYVSEDIGNVMEDFGHVVEDLEYVSEDLEYMTEKLGDMAKFPLSARKTRPFSPETDLFSKKNDLFAENGLVRRFSEIFKLKTFAALIFGFLMLSTPQSHAQTSATERKLEAVFMFNFVQYVEWPTNVFETPDSPFIIGILGNDPFGKILDETVQGETVHGRKLEIRRYNKVSEIKNCQMLFISSSEAGNLKRILAALKSRSILTVSDIDNFAQAGGMICFAKTNNKLRFRINLESAKQAHLSISAKLLQLADVMPDESRR